MTRRPDHRKPERQGLLFAPTIPIPTRATKKRDGELKKLLAAENELFELSRAVQIARGYFGRRHKPLSERRRQIEEELPRIEAEHDVLKIGMLSQEPVLEDAGNLASKSSDLPWEHRRHIVETITDRIVIGKGAWRSLSCESLSEVTAKWVRDLWSRHSRG